MGVEHNGLTLPIHCHGRVTGLAIPKFFFLHQMDDAVWQ
jgi:hypothetical protein